jgi:hypothetical protein
MVRQRASDTMKLLYGTYEMPRLLETSIIFYRHYSHNDHSSLLGYHSMNKTYIFAVRGSLPSDFYDVPVGPTVRTGSILLYLPISASLVRVLSV